MALQSRFIPMSDSRMRVVPRLECGKIPPNCAGFERALDGSGIFMLPLAAHVARRKRMRWHMAGKEFTECGNQLGITAGFSLKPYSACSVSVFTKSRAMT